MMLICIHSLRAQESVSGQIKDDLTQQTLIGATVRNLTLHTTTSTNKEGLFSIAIKTALDTLLFSAIGYQEQKLTVANFLKINHVLSLQPINMELREVVVSTGYQKLSQKNLTGAFTQIDTTLLERSSSPDFLTRIDGISNAVNFDRRRGNDQKFSIRGISTLTENATAPLIILDDFPYQGDLRNINPDEIASITLLKDAAAAAIWGVGAANGVLVISTKKGKLKQPLQITYHAAFNSTTPPNLYQNPQMSNVDFLNFEEQLFNLGYFNSTLNNTRNRPVVSPYVEQLAKFRSGLMTQQQLADAKQTFMNEDVRADFEQYVYQPAQSTLHSLSFTGGTSKSAHTLNLGYTGKQNNLIGNGGQKLNVHSENTYQPFKFMKVDLGVFYTHSEEKLDAEGGYGSMISGGGKNNLYPYAALADGNGSPLAIPKDARFGYIDTAGSGKLLDWKYRPLAEAALNNHHIKSNAVILKVGAQFKILPSLNVDAKYQYENGNSQDQLIYAKNSYYVRNLVNRYSTMNGNTVVRNIPYGAIKDQTLSGYVATSGRLQFNYDHTFAIKHHLNMIAGAEIRTYVNQSQSYRYYGFDEDILTSTAVDYKTSFPIYGVLSSNSTILNKDNNEKTTSHNVSLFSALYYTYAGKYTFSSSLRRDANNLFGATTNNKWQPLWSAGFSWNVSDENFYPKTFPSTRLRMSYGYTGNVNGNVTAYTILTYRQAAIGSTSLTGLPNANITGLPNPDLKWESTGILNIGLELNGKGNPWSLSIDVYHKNSQDLIGLIPADPTLGGTTAVLANTAVLASKGIDLSLNYPIRRSKIWGWDVNFLYSFNRNEVKKYLYTPTFFSSYIGDGAIINPILGQAAYNMGSYTWQGLDAQGNPMVFINGQSSKDYASANTNLALRDIHFGGSALPTHFGAIRNDFNWKRLALSVNVSYQLGYYYRRPSINYSSLASAWNGHPDYANRWQNPGDELKTNVPSFIYPLNSTRDQVYSFSDLLVEPADHVRLKDIRLSYTMKSFPHFKNSSIFLIGTDLGLIWKASHYPTDPEYSATLAPSKTISIGFKTNIQ